MLRNADVATVMTRVERALTRAGRAPGGATGVVVLHAGGDGELGLAKLRHPATIQVDLPSGSARPVVGPAVRFAKRVVRRGLRWYVKPIMEQQSRFNHAVLDLAERLRLSYEKLLAADADATRDRVDELDAALDRLRADLDAATAAAATAATAATGAGESGVPAGNGGSAEAVRPSARLALQYRAFEDRHRGAVDDIKELLRVYLPWFRGCRRVLDVGCGRGEFLSLLADEGIDGYGVDFDDSMVAAAAARGLEVVHDDAIRHLRGLTPGQVDGIFSSQVAEHLSTSELMALLEVAHRKLAPGGVLVIETPNPESLFIFSAFFYVDLTHVKPIHPEAMRWALEATGFGDIRIERVLPVPDGARLDPVPAELQGDEGWAAMAANVDRLNVLLYGPQHFAAVGFKARRPGDGGES